MCIKRCQGRYRLTPPPPIGLVGLPQGCSCPSAPQDLTGLGTHELGTLALQRGASPPQPAGVRMIPIAFEITLLFSAYLPSAVQALINGSVIAGRRVTLTPVPRRERDGDAPSLGLWLPAAISVLEAPVVGFECLH